MDDMSDNNLIVAWRQGDELAEAELVRRYRNVVINSVARFTVDVTAAERITDAGFATAREQFDPKTETILCHLLRLTYDMSNAA